MKNAHLFNQAYNRKKLALTYVLIASRASTGKVEQAIKKLTLSHCQPAAVPPSPSCRSRISKSFYDPAMGVHLKTWSFGMAP